MTTVLHVLSYSTLVIDGQTLVVALGSADKTNFKTFGDFSEAYMKSVFGYGAQFERIDLVFDRYHHPSIKGGSRLNRKKAGTLVRRVIESENVPFPSDFNLFLSNEDNKTDLAKFLSFEFIKIAPEDKIILTSGGLPSIDDVSCNKSDISVDELQSTHEEADTRMLLHCTHTMSESLGVWSRDTDVFLLLLAHSNLMNKAVYMKAGTSSAPKYIDITM